MKKKLWTAPEYLELGVKSTECFTLPTCHQPGGWTNSSGNTCGNNFGHTIDNHFRNHSGKRW